MDSPFSALFSYLDVGYSVGLSIEKRSKSWAKFYFCAMGFLLLTTAVALGLLHSTGKLEGIALSAIHTIDRLVFENEAGPLGIAASSAIAFFIALILLSFPGSVFFLLLRRKVIDSRPILKSPKHCVFQNHRARASKDAYFAGVDATTGAPIYISDDSRMEHTQIVGVTGGGKTEGGIVPALIHDIAWGRGAVIIDMKGDRSLLSKIAAAVIAAGRKDDLLYFSLADPLASRTYNPLNRGNASELKDKIISSNLWSEVYYKKASEIAVLGLCHALIQLKRPVTFISLLTYMRDVKKIEGLKGELDQRKLPNNLDSLLAALDGKTRDLTGLIADFTAIVGSDFGPLLSPEKPEIDLLDAYLNNKIVLFQLNTGLYQETAIRLARIVIQDIKTVSNHVQSYLPAAQRHFFPVFIDEFASIAFEAFVELISKARSAKIAISIAHQSLGDLKNTNDGFQNQIFDNTNIRIVYRQNSAESRDLITKMAGTVEKEKLTHQTDRELGMNVNTGRGSVRQVESFKLDPNLITEFQTGYCALLLHKNGPKDRVRYMKSDFIDISAETDFLRRTAEEIKKSEPEARIEQVIDAAESAPEMDLLKRCLELLR